MDPGTVTVLVVDDHHPMRHAIVDQLKGFGITSVVAASNGEDALAILVTQPFDVVISDWDMPGMNGLELLRRIRSSEAHCHLPFLMLTADADRQRLAEAVRLGVSDCLVKPYTAKQLQYRLERMLRAWHLPRGTLLQDKLPGNGSDARDRAGGRERKSDAQMTLLIVDDEPGNLHLLAEMFKNEYRIKLANSGLKALSICFSESPPDLVLLDVMMPGMDGFEVASTMHAHPSAEGIPIIFVTAMSDEDSRLRGMNLGAVDFITKPVAADRLRPRVRNFMRYVGLRRQLQDDYDEMLALARLRDQVEAITHHDMKGPLSAIIGLSQAMLADASTIPRQAERARLVEDTALQLIAHLNLSTEIYRIESGQYRLQPEAVDIAAILRRLVASARAGANEKRLVIALDADMPMGTITPLVAGEATFCHSIFENLLKNACEAAPPSSRVAVSLEDGDPLRIMVTNKGAVPKAIRHRFFEKFVTFGKRRGTGIGTYSARLLTEAQGGSIELSVSDEDDTTSICVSLPRHTGTRTDGET